MVEQISNSAIGKYISPPIGAALGGLLTWLTTGSTGIGPGLVAFAAILCGVGGVAFSQIYRRYVGVLAAGGHPRPCARDPLVDILA